MVGEPEIIAAQLKKILKYKLGAHASVLYQDAPELVDLLCPADESPMEDHKRALRAEGMIRRACKALDGPTGQALEVLYAFAPGTSGTPLERRREEAGKILSPYGIQADTVRRDHNEKPLLFALAFELYKLIVMSVHFDVLSEIDQGGPDSLPSSTLLSVGVSRGVSIVDDD
jgi:hypothetical protein